MVFVDGDEDNKPNYYYLPFESLVQIIVASPPKGAYQRWIKQATPNLCITKLATSLWSPCELRLTGKTASYFGYNPRQCFDASYSVARLEAKMEGVLTQIADMGKEPSRILHALPTYPLQRDTVSHTIFDFTQSMKHGHSNHATVMLSRDEFLIPCWAFAKLTKLMRPLNSTADFQGCLERRRFRAICSKGRYWITSIPTATCQRVG